MAMPRKTLVCFVISAISCFGGWGFSRYFDSKQTSTAGVQKVNRLSCQGFEWCRSDSLSKRLLIQISPPFDSGCLIEAWKTTKGWVVDSSRFVPKNVHFDSLSFYVLSPQLSYDSLIFDGTVATAMVLSFDNNVFASVDLHGKFGSNNWDCRN